MNDFTPHVRTDVNVCAMSQSPLKRTSQLKSASADWRGDLYPCGQNPRNHPALKDVEENKL